MTKSKAEEILGVKITVEPEKGCWFIREDWSNYTTIKGEIAHRFVYSIFVGPLITGRCICHHCDRPGCINPEHLYQGTLSDNSKDIFKRKRRIDFFSGKAWSPHSKEFAKWKEQDRLRRLRRFVGESDGDWNRRRDFFPD